MDENKKIDLQKHRSQKVPRSYLIRFAIYLVLTSGLLFAIYYLGYRDSSTTKKSSSEKIEEIRNYTLDTLS